MSSLRERPIAILPGQYFDAETGLHQNHHRDYDPSIGRYLQSDAVGLQGGPSTYSYAGANPIGRIDPSGLAWSSADYFNHYNNGGGQTVTLSQMGLLQDFVNSSSVQAGMRAVGEGYRQMLKGRLSEECKCSMGTVQTSFDAHHFDQTYDVTYASQSLLPIGDGMLFNKGRCKGTMDCSSGRWSGSCNLKFYVRDRFTDPWDYFDVIPGQVNTGTPYRIHGDWRETMSWSE